VEERLVRTRMSTGIASGNWIPCFKQAVPLHPAALAAAAKPSVDTRTGARWNPQSQKADVQPLRPLAGATPVRARERWLSTCRRIEGDRGGGVGREIGDARDGIGPVPKFKALTAAVRLVLEPETNQADCVGRFCTPRTPPGQVS